MSDKVEALKKKIKSDSGSSASSSASKSKAWLSFKSLDVKHPEDKPESFSRSFIRMASAAHHAASLDLKLALPDVAYTIIFLSGIAFTSTWADFAIPRICSIFSPDASLLTFNCVEGVIFSWVFITTVTWTIFLPYHTFNPWAVVFSSEFTNQQRLIKFAIQIASAAAFGAYVLPLVTGDGHASRVYADSIPKLHLCSHVTATSFHVKHFKDHKCLDEWPRIDEDGVFHIGATGYEAMHTCGLNAALGIALPHTPSALAPVVVAIAVITAIRSPWGHLTGPALNMGPATVGAFMHGGWDSLRVHAIGTFIGVLAGGLVVSAIREVMRLLMRGSKEKQE